MRTCVPEKGGGEILVNRSGYIPTRNKLEAYLLAGKRLIDYQETLSDFYSEEEALEAGVEITRVQGFDPADASQAMNELRAKGRRKKDESKEKEIAKEAAAESESNAGEQSETQRKGDSVNKDKE